jgi:hypothetical protein
MGFRFLGWRACLRLALWVAGCGTVVWPAVSAPTAQMDGGSDPILEFIQPTNGAVFGVEEEIPVMIRAFSSDDAFPTAELFANQGQIATLSYCCALCPCPAPFQGQEMILQIPVPWDEGGPPSNLWQGWKSDQAGIYRLTARATGQYGTMIETEPVTITVLDRTLHIDVGVDGAVTLRIPQGSLVPGGYDLEASEDLQKWTRLGPFLPGDVAAFYYDVPPPSAREMRFYRSVYVPPE